MFPGRQRVLYGLMPEAAKGVVDTRKSNARFCSSVHYCIIRYPPCARLCEPLGHHYCGKISSVSFFGLSVVWFKSLELVFQFLPYTLWPPMTPYAPDDPVLLYNAHLRPRHDSWTPAPGSSTYDTNTAIPSIPASPTYPPTNSPQPLSSIQVPSSSLSESGTIPGPLVFTTTFPVTTVTQPTTTFTSFTESIITQHPSSPASSLSQSIPSPASAALSTQSLVQSRTGALCPGDGFDSAAAGIIATVLIPAAIGLILWVNPLHQMIFFHQRLTFFSLFSPF